MTIISTQASLAAQLTLGRSSSTSSDTSSSAGSASSAAGTPVSTAVASSPAASSSATDVAAAKAAAANSSSYSFATVGQNARTVLTAGEQQPGLQTPDDHTTGAQWQQIFGGMDRRSMYAVATNQGGQFSAPEQEAAQALMNQQASDLVGNVGAMSNKTDQMNAFGKLVQFLNTVSPEEKASSGWALGMASAKTSYNDEASDLGEPQQTDDGTNPLVKVLMAAMKAGQSDPSTAKTVAGPATLQGILSQPWATGFQTQIQSAFAATIPPGSSINITA